MSRRFLALAAVFALVACKVEPTPRDYIDRTGPAAEEREAAREELRSFLLAFTSAAGSGDHAAALAALAATPQSWLVVPEADTVVDRAGFVAAVMQEVRAAAPLRYEMAPHDVRIAVGPRSQIGWFVVRLVPAAGAESVAAPAPPLWLSGVYQRSGGAWELMQAHLSRTAPAGVSAASPPEPSPSPVMAPARSG